MKLVTVATGSDLYFPYLLESVERHNTQIEVLGYGQTWRGFTWRVHLLRDYLQGVPGDEVVCVIDAYDVLMLRPLEDLEAAFHEFSRRTGFKIVTGAEKVSNASLLRPILTWLFGTCRGSLLNAGTYVGFASDILKMVEDMLAISSEHNADDQKLMTAVCSATPHVHVDVRGDFFLTLSRYGLQPDKLDISGNVLTYQGTRPFFVHGNAQTNMNDIVRRLGYPMTDRQARAIASKLDRVSVQKIFVYAPHFANLCLCICMCLCLSVLCFWWSRKK